MMLEKVIETIIDQTYALDRIHTSYIISFIIYLLEDEQELSLGMLIRLQHIYNLWSIHAMFIIFLHDFGMIWLELTRTGAIFSRTTVVLFLWRNKRGGHEVGGAPTP